MSDTPRTDALVAMLPIGQCSNIIAFSCVLERELAKAQEELKFVKDKATIKIDSLMWEVERMRPVVEKAIRFSSPKPHERYDPVYENKQLWDAVREYMARKP